MRTLNDRTFREFIADGEKIVVCTAGYCKLCSNAIKQVEDIEGIGVICLTAANCIATMSRLNVKKVPTVITYRDGKEVKRAVGTTALFHAIDQACKS